MRLLVATAPTWLPNWALKRFSRILEDVFNVGVNQYMLVPEPVAAGVTILAGLAEKATVGIFDMGGGTFDTALLTMNAEERVVYAIKTEAGKDLGGERVTAFVFDAVEEDSRAALEAAVSASNRSLPLVKHDLKIEVCKMLSKDEHQVNKLVRDGFLEIPVEVGDYSETVKVDLSKLNKARARHLADTFKIVLNSVLQLEGETKCALYEALHSEYLQSRASKTKSTLDIS